MNAFKIENVIYCEGIRAEVGGKYTLVGVCAPDLFVSSLPVAIPFSLFIEGFPERTGEFDIHIRIVRPDGSVAVGVKAIFGITSLERTSMPLGPLPLELTVAGDYKAEWSLDDNVFEDLHTLRIRLGVKEP